MVTHYRHPRVYRPFVLGLTFVMAIVLLGLVIGLTQVSAPFALLGGAFLACFVWFDYRWLFCRAYALDLDMSDLRWQAPLRSGHISVDDLTAVRPSRVTRGTWVLESSSARSVPVGVVKGFSEFLQDIQMLRPDLVIETRNFSIKVADSGFGSSGFSREA